MWKTFSSVAFLCTTFSTFMSTGIMTLPIIAHNRRIGEYIVGRGLAPAEKRAVGDAGPYDNAEK